MRNFIPVLYGTVFLQNPGIFRYGISLTFSSQDFLEIVRKFLFFLYWCVCDQFKEFPKLLGLLYIRKLPKNKFRHHNKHYHHWGKVKQMQPMLLCILKGKQFEDTH